MKFKNLSDDLLDIEEPEIARPIPTGMAMLILDQVVVMVETMNMIIVRT